LATLLSYTTVFRSKSEPRIQFINIQYLQDVLSNYAKNLVIQMRLDEIKNSSIEVIVNAFRRHRGNHTVTFEVYEFEQIPSKIESPAPIALKPQLQEAEIEGMDDILEHEEMLMEEEISEELLVETEPVEEVRPIVFLDRKSVV